MTSQTLEAGPGGHLPIAECRNVRALGRVSYIDYTENLKISTEMVMNEKLPNSAENFPNESLANFAKFIQTLQCCGLSTQFIQTLHFR